MPCTNKLKKEVPFSGRTFDSRECDSLQMDSRASWCFSRERETEREKAKLSSLPSLLLELSIVFLGPWTANDIGQFNIEGIEGF